MQVRGFLSLLSLLFLLVVFLGAAGCESNGKAEPGQNPGAGAEPGGYVYSFFREPNGHTGLRLAFSRDLFSWTEMEGEIFKPEFGAVFDGDKRVFRDAFVAPDPDGGYHMVWTTSWRRDEDGLLSVGYAHSPDLLTWENQRPLRVMPNPAAVNVWAPKLFYDEGQDQWLILWSTTLEDDTFPPPVVPGTTMNQRTWYVTTRDFQTVSEPKVLFDPGFSCIDAYLLQDGSDYYLFFKDERANKRTEFNAEYQNIRMAHADSPYGPWGDVSPVITGGGAGKWENEGPSAIKVDRFYYVFYDHHGRDGPYFGATRSADLETWTDVTSLFQFPTRSKHGHIFHVSSSALERLIAAGGS